MAKIKVHKRFMAQHNMVVYDTGEHEVPDEVAQHHYTLVHATVIAEPQQQAPVSDEGVLDEETSEEEDDPSEETEDDKQPRRRHKRSR